MKALAFWFADLWPADCIYCIYLRFLLVGVFVGMFIAAAYIYAVVWTLGLL